MDKFIMSRKEREQLTVFKELNSGKTTQAAAAQMLGGSGKRSSASELTHKQHTGFF
jgi:hypothetical protein